MTFRFVPLLLILLNHVCMIAFAYTEVARARKSSSYAASLKSLRLFSSASTSGLGQVTRGLLPRCNDASVQTTDYDSWKSLPFKYVPPSKVQLFWTRFALWRQVPWRKIDGKVMLRAKLGGSLSVQDDPTSLFTPTEKEAVNTLTDLTNLCLLGAYDPRVHGIFVDLTALSCGYAKLDEAIRWIDFFKQSGKPVIGYATTVTEKEYYLSRAFSEFYVAPTGDNNFDLRGFALSSSFYRQTFNKIGVEPQVQRIGKYKSFGDTFMRDSMSEAQREVASELLYTVSDRWAQKMAAALNQSFDEIAQIWSDPGVKNAQYYVGQKRMANGTLYLDQVEALVHERFGTLPKRSLWQRVTSLFQPNATQMATNEDEKDSQGSSTFDVVEDFAKNPRRQLGAINQNASTEPYANDASSDSLTSESSSDIVARKPSKTVKFYGAQQYLSRMRRSGTSILKGVPVSFTSSGSRIAIVSAVGSIVDGKSSRSNRNIGAQTMIDTLRKLRKDEDIQAVVLQIDSPGGSAMASDLVWRELRCLAKEKPVVACMVDVAASGGYYFAMACDQIVAEEMTLTGSIGVVFGKINAETLLRDKLGINVETLSVGRYAELLSTSRGFTEDEVKQFEGLARQSYDTFVSKAAASRSMSVEQMENFAQGRVWTGREALARGLVDHMGGLWSAVDIARQLVEQESDKEKSSAKKQKRYRVEMVKEKSANTLLGLLSQASEEASTTTASSPVLALASEEVFSSNLACPWDSLGGHPALSQLSIPPAAVNFLKGSHGLAHIPALLVDSLAMASHQPLLQQGMSLLRKWWTSE